MTLQRLGDVCEFRYGSSLPASTRSGAAFNVYGSNGVVGTHDSAITAGETIVVGRKGSIGEINFSQNACWPIDTTYFVDASCTSADLRWLFYALQGLRLGDLNKATGVPGLNRNDAYQREIFVPPLAKQKRIAAILDQADELRRKRQRAIDRLNQLGQAIFYEMFGDANSPSGWRHQERDIAEVCIKVTDGTHQSPKWADEGVPFIFVSNVRNQRINLTTKKFVDEAEYQKLTKHTKIEAGDVLYTCVGSYGHAAVVDERSKFVFQRHIAHLKPSTKLIQPQFLAWCLESPIVRAQADRVATGIAQKTVTLSGLKSFKVPLPPLDRQEDFATRLAELNGSIVASETHLTKLEALFNASQHRAFRGEL